MAQILIRPEDLARVAQRFDAAAHDLSQAVRRLARNRDEVVLNVADETFPAARFGERSRSTESNLRRLADEFRLDAGLMARTVDDADFDVDADADGDWTAGLGPAIGGDPVGPWTVVAAGLTAMNTAGPGTAGTGQHPRSSGNGATDRAPMKRGGLFASASLNQVDAARGASLLDRVVDRLGSTPAPAAGSGELWSRIVDEMFAADNDS